MTFSGRGRVLMRMRDEVLARMRRFPHWLPREPLHGWRSAPDDGDHIHCENCGETVYVGNPVVGTYLEYVSIVFCSTCAADNCGLLWDWMGRDPLANL
jgi:hypothetical protein